MKCQQIREEMPDRASGLAPASREFESHMAACATCADEWAGMQQTMQLLDEWTVPEPSPYFDTRLNARLREEMSKPSGWLHWFRKPVLALSLAGVALLGFAVYRQEVMQPSRQPMAQVGPGTAVGDLQALDKNNELYSDFDLLDDLQVQQDVTANP